MLNLARTRLTAASEEGFGLIEVLVSGAVLVIVVLGVMAGLDSVSRTAGANQSKTVASVLAEKDLERLRSLRTADLSKLKSLEPETATVDVGGVTYTVTSKAQLVSDSSGEDVSCSTPNGEGGYLRITSTVTSQDTRIKPVTLSSLVAPQPGLGTLTALVRNADSAPLVKLPVQAIGLTPGTQQTNAAGCAIFIEREAGSYTARINQATYVDPDGNQQVDHNVTVSAGNVTLTEFLYDVAGSFNVSVVRSDNSADLSSGVIAAHTGVTLGYRAVAPASQATAFGFTSMFPFTSAYEVFAGTCEGNNPANWDENYFPNHPLAVAKVNRGENPGPARRVYEPTMNLNATYQVNSNTPTNLQGARVYAYPKTDGCPTDRITLNTTQSTGRVSNPGLPFGIYDFCVDYNGDSSTRRRRRIWTNVANTSDSGTATMTAAFKNTDADAGSTNGFCGATTPTA